MPAESALTVDEKTSLTIERFIFHVILHNETQPRFMTEVVLPNAGAREFFRQRIAEAAEGTQYVFLNPPSGQVLKESCERMLAHGADFVNCSQTIAAHFQQFHSGSTSDGVIIVAVVSVMHRGNPVRMVSLLKMDHQQVFRYLEEAGDGGMRARIEELANTFVEDKTAVQKSAIIEVGQGFAWDVLARDRSARDGITDYFRNFLSVQPYASNSRLTLMAVSAVRKWAKAQDVYPEGEDAAGYRRRAYQYLAGNEVFDSEEFIRSVVLDQDRARREGMMESLRGVLLEDGVAGQRFRPIPKAIERTNQVRMKTELGVKLEWEGRAEDRGVTLPSERSPDGFFHIEIRTTDDPRRQV
jgi:hypothetical protein